MAAEFLYFCTTCDNSFSSLDGLTLVRDWHGRIALYRGHTGVTHILRRKKFPKPPEPAPEVAPSAPQEVFVDVLAEVMAETETRPELPADPLEEPDPEPEERVEAEVPWKRQLREWRDKR